MTHQYEIIETTHGFEVLRDGQHTWEPGHVWTELAQAVRDADQLRRQDVGRRAYRAGRGRDWVLDTACTDTVAWQRGWDIENATDAEERERALEA